MRQQLKVVEKTKLTRGDLFFAIVMSKFVFGLQCWKFIEGSVLKQGLHLVPVESSKNVFE